MYKRQKKIAIIDFDLGNISSVQAACEYVGADTIVLNKQDKHIECQISGVILPGVGAFSKAIQSIKETGLSDTIQEAILEKKPVMAICLGHQLLFEKSFEFGISNGLGILKGDVISIDSIPAKQFKPRVPNVGWFELNLMRPNEGAFTEISSTRLVKPSTALSKLSLAQSHANYFQLCHSQEIIRVRKRRAIRTTGERVILRCI